MTDAVPAKEGATPAPRPVLRGVAILFLFIAFLMGGGAATFAYLMSASFMTFLLGLFTPDSPPTHPIPLANEPSHLIPTSHVFVSYPVLLVVIAVGGCIGVAVMWSVLRMKRR